MPRYSLGVDELGEASHEEEEEPPHPVGFGCQWTRTWIGLEPPTSLLGESRGQSRYALEERRGHVTESLRLLEMGLPPLSSFVHASTASTRALLQYGWLGSENVEFGQKDSCELELPWDDEEEADLSLLKTMLKRKTPETIPTASSSTKFIAPYQDATQSIAQKMQLERQRLEQEHQDMNHRVEKILDQLEKEAATILKNRQQQEETALREKKAEDAKQKKLEQDRILEEQRQKKLETEAREALANKRQEAEKRKAQKTEYVTKAKKLVAQLVTLRESIEPFEKNKAVSKRRLGMKKITRGKLNTLTENVGRIQEVAAEVAQAILTARSEDEKIKQSLERKEQGFSPDMARGKRYLVDLLASNTIQRVQAEGFNGPRGDGFPLAAMLSMVSLENKELVPILAAHIYTVCPTAIPTLPIISSGASEEELMSSLGMLRDKKGEFETFDRFLSRTENVVALVANIMASSPSSHVLLGGSRGAIDWLARFLDLLPPPPTAPLPLLTAPVLHAFLSGAGHMLANKYPDAFQKQLQTVTDDVLVRLDEGPIGKPSSIRLGKLVEGGFAAFKSDLPPKALAELYFGAETTPSNRGGTFDGPGHARHDKKSDNAFVRNDSSTVDANPFSSTNSNQFGPSTGSFSTVSNGFQAGAVDNPFGAVKQPSSIGPSTSKNPFASGPAGDDEMSQTTNRLNTSMASFGTAKSPFAATNTVPPSPFGSTSSSTPFGAGASTPSPSPFGVATSAKPFGGTTSALSSSPFGTMPSTTPFGVRKDASTQSPFGAASSIMKFGRSTNSAPLPSQFGGAGGQFSNNSSFGKAGGNATFGSSSTFIGGARSGKSNDSGASGKGKPPCKFFAQGRCKFGDKCKFSHDSGAKGNGGDFGRSTGGFHQGRNQFSAGFGSGRKNNPFGPRR